MTAFDSQAHQALLDRWKEEPLHKGKGFKDDGVIDPERWNKSSRKVMLLLKECYGDDYDDLRSLIRDKWVGPKYKLWWAVSYWLYAIHKLSRAPGSIPPLPHDKALYDRCGEYLLSAATVNVKKSDGESSSDSENLQKYAIQDKNHLYEQIGLIRPDIILCGNTFDFFKIIVEGKENIVPVGDTGLLFRAGNALVIDWCHPATHNYPNHLCYYALCAVLHGHI